MDQVTRDAPLQTLWRKTRSYKSREGTLVCTHPYVRSAEQMGVGNGKIFGCNINNAEDRIDIHLVFFFYDVNILIGFFLIYVSFFGVNIVEIICFL